MSCAGQSLTSTVVGTCGQLVQARLLDVGMEDVHSATPALPLGTLFLTTVSEEQHSFSVCLQKPA